MTQSDSIPTAQIGQDGSGPDKSTATTLPYTQLGTPSTLANDGLLAGVLADLPGVKAHGHDSFRFWCTQEHKKRHAPAWVAVLDGKVRIGCYDDHGHNDDLWRQHVGPNLVRNQSPRDWLAPLAVAGVSRVARGQFADAIIYGPIWAGPYLLPIEQRELDRRNEVADLDGYNLLRGAIAEQMGQTLPTLSLSHYQAMPTIGQRLRRPQLAVSEIEKMSGSDKGQKALTATRQKLTHAVRSPDMICASPSGWSQSILPDGAVKIRHQPCGYCDRCLAWRRREIALRFVYAAGDAQCTMIRVSGWGSNEWDKAAAWLDAMGRRQVGQRWRGLRPAEDYTPTATAIYPCEVSAAVIDLVRKDATRKGLSLTVDIGTVDIAAFGGLLDTMKTRTGNVLNKATREYVRHCTSRFVAWPDYQDDLPDYVIGDTTMYKRFTDQDMPPETPVSEIEATLRGVKDVEHRAESAAYIRMGRVDYLDVGLFLNLPNEPDPDGEVMDTIKRREYGGSSQLLIDAARHYVGDAPYRAAYCAVYERVFGDDWTYTTGGYEHNERKD